MTISGKPSPGATPEADLLTALSKVMEDMEADALAVQTTVATALAGAADTPDLPPELQRLDLITQRLAALSRLFAAWAETSANGDLREHLGSTGLASLDEELFREPRDPDGRGTGDVAMF